MKLQITSLCKQQLFSQPALRRGIELNLKQGEELDIVGNEQHQRFLAERLLDSGWNFGFGIKVVPDEEKKSEAKGGGSKSR